MNQDLIAVYESGATRAPAIPQDTRQRLAVNAGEDLMLNFCLLDASGAPLDTTTGSPVFTFTAKRKLSDGDSIVQVNLTAISPPRGRNWLQAVVPGNLTSMRRVRPGSYVWLLTRVLGGETSVLVPASQFTILPTGL